jgi:c-di-GMP phosphodiesterase
MEIFLARQPIFDADDRLAGYELLYRRTGTVDRAEGSEPDQMSADVIVSAFLSYGMESLTGGADGFLNCTREMLVEGTFELLPRDRVVIELLESIAADEDVASACAHLSAAGYRLALDDFELGGGAERLLPHASIVKIDVLNRTTEDLESVVRALRPYGVRILAERVETREVWQACRAMGFELFQGYFFSRPEIVARREIPTDSLAMIRLMNLLRDEAASDASVAEAFRSDLSLTYRLLRMVNAAAIGGRGIESIEQAVRLLGRATLLRWLALLMVSSLGRGSAVDGELVRMAIQRARLMELLGHRGGGSTDPGGLFLVGLLSTLDALLQVPIDRVLAAIDLSAAVGEALRERRGVYAPYLSLAEAYERGRWERVADLAVSLRISALDVPALYLESLRWARERAGS